VRGARDEMSMNEILMKNKRLVLHGNIIHAQTTKMIKRWALAHVKLICQAWYLVSLTILKYTMLHHFIIDVISHRVKDVNVL